MLKTSAAYVYTAYVITFLTNIFGPRIAPRAFLHYASMKFTCAISNVPGPIKAWYVENDKGERGYGRWCQTYVMIAGRVGFNISCMSYDNCFKITALADQGIMTNTR